MNNNSKRNSGCRKYEELIQKRLDGVITPGENAELDEHLADCPHCFEELTSFAAVQDMLGELKNNPEDVPEGLFEKMAANLEDVKPVTGLAALFSHPVFAINRNLAFGMASVVLVAILTISVASGALAAFGDRNPDRVMQSESKALIMMNSGEKIVLTGDEGDPDQYAAALDDLERAYLEAQGQDIDEDSEGYIHTSWRGGESATPLQ